MIILGFLNFLAANEYGLPEANENDVLASGLSVFFIAMGIIAVGTIIYAGIQYMISIGDNSKISHAKLTLLYAIVGLAVSALAYALVNFVIKGTD